VNGGYFDGSREGTDAIGIPSLEKTVFPAAPALTAATGLNVAVPEAFLNAYLELRFRGEQYSSEYNIVVANRDPDYVLPSATFLDLTITSLGLRLWSPAGSSKTTISPYLCGPPTSWTNGRHNRGSKVSTFPHWEGRSFWVCGLAWIEGPGAFRVRSTPGQR